MSLMSMRQYAKHRGVTVEAVSKAVKAGRISCNRDERGYAQIDPDVADREWDANTDPGKSKKPLTEAPSEADENAKTVKKSAAIYKMYQARLTKLEFEEQSGQLHNVDQCKRDAFKVARAVRDALLGIPDRLSAELSGESDQFIVRQKLDAEIRQALQALAADLEEILE
jgi:hypothetical protein